MTTPVIHAQRLTILLIVVTAFPKALCAPTHRSSIRGAVWNQQPPLFPLRAIAYGDLPCAPHRPCNNVLPPESIEQAGYEAQWGPKGRNDLGAMKQLGANAVRLYHSMGANDTGDHQAFLDHAQSLGLNVLPGIHSNNPEMCKSLDCFHAWKAAVLDGFGKGYGQAGAWHPAVPLVILMNEPDFYQDKPQCVPKGSWCRVRAALSALDGLLAAEREAGVAPGGVKLTITWSFAKRVSIDGTVDGPGLYGFQDMVAGIANPALANYTPRSSLAELQEAFKTRWIHSLNTQAPWTYVHELVSKNYAKFEPVPWFIGEYGALGQTKDVIQSDLVSMDTAASSGGSFSGVAFFQFQTAYWKGGAEMNFGLFGLGTKLVGQTDIVCDMYSQPCRSWSVYCLSPKLNWLPGTMADRAQAVMEAWGGVLPSNLC